ncbi:hypothetical protein QQS21_007509 [Conoideocrella luteorostrata]|uniref:N-acetyltransferase domain-containing protein n=1 Tax=Conoideocrella luteorostrata TaxID=1105319 RepID=A0AAJ0FSB9_9HYPO|nr:hypothetical protein QQS21_007509 [Conoideocrella luteorostrata]
MASYKLIKNCTVDDAPGLAINNMTAFYGEPWWQMQWEKPLEEIIKSSTVRYPHNLLKNRQAARHQKVVDTSTGQLVGYARWVLPESHAHCWLEAQVPDVNDDDKRRFKSAFELTPWDTRPETDNSDYPIGAQFRKHAPKGPYIKLDYLGVHPDHHHRGIGTTLVQAGISIANQLKTDLYLIAMGQNAYKMYKKCGFEELDSLSQDLRQWDREGTYDTWIMIKHCVAHDEN